MSSDNAPAYPRPVIVDYTVFLYEGFASGELRVQHCDDCGQRRHPPNPFCSRCHSSRWTAKACGTRGIVHSYTVQHYPPIPPYATPHAVVLVDMEAGFRFLAALREVRIDEIRIGMQVEARFVELEPGFTLPVFYPVAQA